MSLIRSRFKKAANKTVNQYTASLPFDWRLYPYDIAGSIAHAQMLAKQEIISGNDADSIIKGLTQIKVEIEQGKFKFNIELEDIHMSIESRLIDKIGEIGGKLHTARSRNDQVALDMRLFTRDAIENTIDKICSLQKTLIEIAEKYKEIAFPGYTHLQHAQPVLLAHHLLAYYEMLQRDVDRFNDCMKRTDVMPLGSGALAGVSYNIDRKFVARELGFSRISQNSLDAVSDRDFVIEYESAASICMMHLSRLAEETILWSSAEFGFVELDDAYATGSSIMPQKKNPDVAELARGKTGRVYGNLLATLTILKALPLSYNRDLQEDKERLFDTTDTLLSTLEVFNGMIATMTIKIDRINSAVGQGYILATDIADYLVKKGETFRNAHRITGKLVSWAIEKRKTLDNIKIADYRSFSSLFEMDIYQVTIASSLEARNNIGGTAPKQVKKAIASAKKAIANHDTRINNSIE